mmetsp:Transcript_19141/g.38698  ORF Transcript_19141/g.38698 Transcript_19141/m.38698 type:complete len:87 (-) Transcript_19141:166-426(-)
MRHMDSIVGLARRRQKRKKKTRGESSDFGSIELIWGSSQGSNNLDHGICLQPKSVRFWVLARRARGLHTGVGNIDVQNKIQAIEKL